MRKAGSREGMKLLRGTGTRKPGKEATRVKQIARGREQPALQKNREKENRGRKKQ